MLQAMSHRSLYGHAVYAIVHTCMLEFVMPGSENAIGETCVATPEYPATNKMCLADTRRICKSADMRIMIYCNDAARL